MGNSVSFELTMEIEKQGNFFIFFGIRGPLEEQYKSEIIPNNITRTDIDLGVHLGGLRKATAEFRGNTLVAYFHNMVNGHDVIDIIAYNTVDPKTPNEMTCTLKDIESGVELPI